MSDLFKDHKPELTEEEDRLLWQRVRAIPAREPFWRRLFAMPAVRYGAPAFAVLLAAVVYVVERPPTPTLKVEPSAPKASPVSTPPASLPAAKREVAPRPPTTSPALERAEPPSEMPATENETPKAGLDDKDQRRDEPHTFAQPPATDALPKSKAAVIAPAPAPAPVPAPARDETAERNAAPSSAGRMTAQSSPTLAAPPSASTWGAKKMDYLGSGLAEGALPSRAALASHPVVIETAGPGALSGSVPLPDQPGLRAVIALSPEAAPQARIENAKLGLMSGADEYEHFEDAPARLQAAALAVAFEAALANPAATPRAKIERLLVHARAVAARADATPGAARLVAMIEGALRAWPTK